MTRSAKRQKTNQRQATANQPRLPSVALCVIARDEEQFIGKCLASARPFVDEIIVVDTGSTDSTREIARAHGARVEEFAWCDDFSAARNVAIEAATADWILMLDADEELDPASGELLRKAAAELPEGMMAFAISIENRQLATDETILHAVNRLFPRTKDVRYVGAIHEDLCYLPDPGRSMAVFAPAIRAFHYGYDPGVYVARAKDERNMRLLEREIEHNPDNLRMVYHLGQQHFVAGRHSAAAAAFERFIQRGTGMASYYLVDAYRMWIDSVIALGDEDRLNDIVSQAEAAGALSPLSREMLALNDLRHGRPASAKRHLLRALDPRAPAGIATPPGAGGWRSRLLLAEACEKLGDRESALSQLRDAFVDLPARLQYGLAMQAAQLAGLMRQHAETDRWLVQAAHAAPDDLEAHQSLLRLTLDALRRAPAGGGSAVGGPLERALAAEEWQAAYDTAMALPLGTARALAPILFLAGRLREQGAPEPALDLLERAVDTYEPSRPLYWLLMQTLKDLDRFDDALAAIEVMHQLPGADEALPVAA
jgi:glycosyltransferase involved in cell wall biosynthesis